LVLSSYREVDSDDAGVTHSDLAVPLTVDGSAKGPI
jgi:hypothetical protein